MKANQWWHPYIDLDVVKTLESRLGQSIWPGLFHAGGIYSGGWIVCLRYKSGRAIAAVLAQYNSREEFLKD